MSTPARARRSASAPLEQQTGGERSTPSIKNRSGRIEKRDTVIPTGGAGRNRPATRGVKVSRTGADDPAMTPSEPTRKPREAGVSFPMTTTAQVEHRDAIRQRTQARLDELRARRSA